MRAWLERYNSEWPHQALGYLSPHEYRAKEKPPAFDPPNQSLRAADPRLGPADKAFE